MKRVLFLDHVNRILGGAEINLFELLGFSDLSKIWHVGCATPESSPLRKALQDHDISRDPGNHIEFIDYSLDGGLNELRVVGKHPLSPVLKIRSGLKSIRAGRDRFKAILDNFRPDAVISIPNKDHLVASRVCEELNIPHIWWVNDIISPDFFPWMARYSFFRAARSKTSYFAAVSNYAARALESGGIESSRIFTIHNGVPPQKYHGGDGSKFRDKNNISSACFTFGVIGRWAHWKGQKFFIQLADAWEKKNSGLPVQFILIGKAFNEDESFEKQLIAEAEMCNARHKRNLVQMVGYEKEVADVLGGLDCLIHTSLQPEPFGRVIIESMICGKPVIAAKAGAIPEIIDHNRNGLVAESGQMNSYIEQMERIYQDSQLRENLVNEGKKEVSRRFTLDRVKQDFCELVGKITA